MTGKAVGVATPAVSDLVVNLPVLSDPKRRPKPTPVVAKTPAPPVAHPATRKTPQGHPHRSAAPFSVPRALTFNFSSLPGPLLGASPAVESPRLSGRTTRATTRLTGTPLPDVASGKSRFF